MTEPTQPVDSGVLLAVAARAIARGADLDARLDPVLAIALADRGASFAGVALLADDGLVHLVRVAGEAVEAATDAGSSGGSALDRLAQGGAGPGAPETDGAASGGSAAEDPIATAIAERRAAAGGAAGGPPPGPFAAARGLERVLAVPLVVADGGIDATVGALVVGWRAGEPEGDGSPGVLDALADLAAIAVDRAAARSHTAERGDWQERVGHLDPLTGLANRRTLDRVLELEIARAARQLSDISIAVFDVDDFRATNDRDGSAVGDAILRAVASVVAEQVRLVDTVARIGGDEFVVVAPGSGGVVVADRILRAIEALGPVAGVPVSVSAGIARFPADGTAAEELLGAALRALEGARASGRGSIAEVRAG